MSARDAAPSGQAGTVEGRTEALRACGAMVKTGYQFPREEHTCSRPADHDGKHLCSTCYGTWAS